MPDAKAGAWAALNGNEFLNSQRTIAYIKNFGFPITISEDCWCDSIKELLNCPGASGNAANGYDFPYTDPAPWYDPAIPESGDFMGFLTLEFDGLGSTYTRPTFDSLNGGAQLGRLRPQARTLTWKGLLFGRTCCAAEYGMRWLTAQLADAGGCDGCDGAALDILYCCPEITGGITPINRRCGSSLTPDEGVVAPNDAFRTFYNVGLADGPTRGDTRQVGCGHCDQEPGCIIEADFSIVAGNPFMHRDPVEVCSKPFPDCGTCPGGADLNFWKKINTSAYPASLADSDLCANLLECLVAPDDCITDPSCPLPALPTVPAFTDPCGCTPYNLSEICCEVSNDIYGQFFEGVPQIRIFSGKLPLHNVSIKFYENPQERTCSDKDMFDICNLCDEVTIRYIPANSTLTLDGLTKQINIECPGNNINPAESLVSSVFKWPSFKCIDYIVKVGADCNYPIADNTLVTLCVIPKEM